MKICPVAVSFLAGIFQMYALPLRLPQSLTEGGAGSWFKMLMLRIMLATVCWFGSWRLVIKLNFFQTMSTRVGQDFEVGVQARFWSWSLNLGRDSEAGFGQDFEFYICRWCFVEVRSWILVEILKLGLVKILNFKFSGDADVWLRFLVDAESRFWRWNSIKICVWTCNMTLARWTQPSGPLCLWQCF